MTFSDPIFQGPEPGSSSELPLRSFGFWAGRADRSKVGGRRCASPRFGVCRCLARQKQPIFSKASAKAKGF